MPSVAADLIVAGALGSVSWTALEYGLHRFAMHQLRGKGLASREHLAHHADVTYFAPASKKALSAVATTAVVLPLATAVAGPRRARVFTGSLIATYYAYEVAHRRIHTHPPRTAYGRWSRRSHLHHHFGAPLRNLGVTTSVWDRLAGTYDDPGTVTVPRRMAPVWMLGPDGEVRPELADDYRVVGGAERPAQRVRQDRDDAFANRVPAA